MTRPYPKLSLLPKVLAIGSSTGGPQALMKVLKPLYGKCHVPIIITQHMPASFTGIFASQIEEETRFESFEAKDGQALEIGKVYLAPGDYHMCFKQMLNKDVQVRLNQDPPVNYCRPAVDPMFESIGGIYPHNTLAVILTGMGQDGLEGARQIVEESNSNILLSQDKETSAVWGMPAAVAEAGLSHEILPLGQIPHKILTILGQ
ncbi:MAG: CheB methylesterase domain-containing protein [Rickettsiales bacterium]|nr:CheB methylesterase domain-containing protein [Rickettsiales bacterium]